MVNARSKGQRGEREAIGLLQPIVDRVYGKDVISLERNLDQWRCGGADINGLDWCVIEVKRQQSENLSQWWRQVNKAADGRLVPILMWRKNHMPWQYMVRTPLVAGGWQIPPADIRLNQNDFFSWFEFMLRWHCQENSAG